MEILFSDAGIISENHGFKDSLTALMSKEFSRMRFQLFRLDVSLKYEHDQKDGRQRKFCIIIAHLVGCEPITAISEASCFTQAVNIAISKVKTSYIARFGHMWNN